MGKKHHHKYHSKHHSEHHPKNHSNKFKDKVFPHSSSSRTSNNANQTNGHRIPLRYKLLIGVIILNLIVIWQQSIIANFFLFITDFILILVWGFGWSNACPKCKSFWVRKFIDRSHFGTHTEFEEIEREKRFYDAKGNSRGTSSYQSTRPVTMQTIQNHYQCKSCKHFWSGPVHDKRK